MGIQKNKHFMGIITINSRYVRVKLANYGHICEFIIIYGQICLRDQNIVNVYVFLHRFMIKWWCFYVELIVMT